MTTDSGGGTRRARGDSPEEGLLLFLPLHKRAFGMAIGIVLGTLVAGLTVVATVLPGDHTWPLILLSQYFAGYTVSGPGALVGFLWGGFVGFVAGWFAAFCRNFFVALQIWFGKTKEDLEATRDFLDHI